MFNAYLARMAFVFLLVIVIAPSVLAASDSPSQAVRYYAKLAGVISPMLEYTPRGEVTAQRAKTLNHYQVTYNQQGRIAEIRYFQGENRSNSSYFGTHKVTYHYGKDQHSRSYFDVNVSPSAMSRHYYQGGDVHKKRYTYSGNTRLLKIYNRKEERIAVGTGSYEFSAENIDASRFVQRQFKIDGSANVIFDYLPFEVAIITKDANGHLYQIINIDASSLKRAVNSKAGFAEMRLEFDEHGNELGWDFRDEHGNLANRPADLIDGGYAKWQYQFNWINRELGLYHSFTESYQKADGSVYCKTGGVCSVVTYRDQWGNFTGWEYLDKHGKLINNPDDGFAKLVIERDNLGYRQATKYLNADGKLRSPGVAEQRYKRGKDGEEIEISFDAKGKKILQAAR